MGKLFAGPFCDLTGKTGNNVGRWVKGKNIFAIKPHKSSKPATQLMLDQRFKFGLMNEWLSRISELVKPGFENYDTGMSPVNACVSYNLKHAITGVSPNFSIDFSKLLYSRGNLPEAFELEAIIDTPATVKYKWYTPITGTKDGRPTDKATFLVYNPTKDKFVSVEGVIARSALQYALAVPPTWSGDTVECWMSLTDGELVSNSTHVGAFLLL